MRSVRSILSGVQNYEGAIPILQGLKLWLPLLGLGQALRKIVVLMITELVF